MTPQNAGETNRGPFEFRRFRLGRQSTPGSTFMDGDRFVVELLKVYGGDIQ
jgi:hypothetical protein